MHMAIYSGGAFCGGLPMYRLAPFCDCKAVYTTACGHQLRTIPSYFNTMDGLHCAQITVLFVCTYGLYTQQHVDMS